jgi:aspartate aminotransferase
VFISDPTWDNHHLIWETAGPNIERKLYPYYDALTQSLDFHGMIAELETSAQENDVVILHACAHNPTGIDPTQGQWKRIAEIVAMKRLFVIFDSAYQGFASGNLDADAWAIRYFYSTLFGDASLPASETGAGMFVCQSFSKNFGLYGERVGALHLVTPLSVSHQGAYTHLIRLIRGEISCPSLFGERCVQIILTDPELRSKWEADVKIMASRIQRGRMALKSELENIDAQGNWDHIGRQIGMFSYTGLSKTQVHRLKEVHHVYMLGNGRMSLSGLNEKNVAYVARAIKEVVEWN